MNQPEIIADDDREAIHYETVRGVTFPVEPGMSRIRREIERKKALKRMKADDRTLERLKRMQQQNQQVATHT